MRNYCFVVMILLPFIIYFIKYSFTFILVCNFNQALDLKEGEAEAILEELVCKQNMHGENTFLIEFHIRVLDLILNNSRNE